MVCFPQLSIHLQDLWFCWGAVGYEEVEVVEEYSQLFNDGRTGCPEGETQNDWSRQLGASEDGQLPFSTP